MTQKKKVTKKKKVEIKNLKLTNNFIFYVTAVNKAGVPMNRDLATLRAKPFPAFIQQDIYRIFNEIYEEAKNVEKIRKEILEKYVNKEDGEFLLLEESNEYDFKDGCKEKFQKEFDEFLEREIDLKIKPLNIDFTNKRIPDLTYGEMQILKNISASK